MFCCSKALTDMCSKKRHVEINGDFIWFTFDMMLAWEIPSSTEEETHGVNVQSYFFSHHLSLMYNRGVFYAS